MIINWNGYPKLISLSMSCIFENLESLIQNVRIRYFLCSENKEFTFVNDYFQNKKREEVGHYGQALFKRPNKNLESVLYKQEYSHYFLLG